jgi:hypothetical protein
MNFCQSSAFILISDEKNEIELTINECGILCQLLIVNCQL